MRGAGLPGISAPPMIAWIKEQLALIGVDLWIDSSLDEKIGEDFARDIQKRLQEADLAIILVSQDFITSQFIAAHELSVIRERVEKGEMAVFPILVSTVIWGHNENSRWISRFQVYPTPNKPLSEAVTSLRDMKHHRTEILRLIKNLIHKELEKSPAQTTIASGSPTAGKPVATPWKGKLVGALAGMAVLVAAFFGYQHWRQPSPQPGPSAPSASLQIPVILSPRARNPEFPPAVYGSKVLLEWSALRVPDMDSFEVEVSTSTNFTEKATFSKQTPINSLILERAQQNSKLLGKIYWRVRTLRTKDAKVAKGDWSEVAQFEIYDNALSRIALSQRLVVGTSAFNERFGDTIRKKGPGDYEGLDADIIAEITRHLKARLNLPQLSPQFVNVQWADMFRLLSDNQADVIVSGITASQNREREYKIRFSRPYYSTAQVAMAFKSSGLKTLKDALQRKAYSIKGMSGSSVAQAVFAQHEYSPGVRYDLLFSLLGEHTDSVVVHDYALLYSQAVGLGTADQYVFFPIVTADLPEEKRKPFLEAHNSEDCDRWALGVAESQTELLNEINGCIDLLEADGVISRLIVHHNYPESSLQNCQVTLSYLKFQSSPANVTKPETGNTPPAPTTEKPPAASGKPEVETVPF